MGIHYSIGTYTFRCVVFTQWEKLLPLPWYKICTLYYYVCIDGYHSLLPVYYNIIIGTSYIKEQSRVLLTLLEQFRNNDNNGCLGQNERSGSETLLVSFTIRVFAETNKWNESFPIRYFEIWIVAILNSCSSDIRGNVD